MRLPKGRGPFQPLILLVIIIFLVTPAYGTVLRGDVYNASLDKISNVVVVVDSNPVQRYVVKNGTYRFELPPGKYSLSARSFDDEEQHLGTDEEITIKEEGTFVSDLVLEPFNESEKKETPGQTQKNGLKSILQVTDIIFIIGIAIVISFLAWKFTRKRKKKEEESDFDDNTSHLLNIIKSEKRMTQKELRKHFDLSEAKVSLIVSELEKKGLVKRVKKGRGNIIIYNEGSEEN